MNQYGVRPGRFRLRRHPVLELRARLMLAVLLVEEAIGFVIGLLVLAFSRAVWGKS